MIELPAKFLDQISAAAVAAYPVECCGLIAGHGGEDGTPWHVTRIVKSPNEAQGPGHDRFEVSPKVRFDLMRELGDGPDRIIGHYHSHPDHPAHPSPTDISMAWEPDLFWVITAVSAGSLGTTAAFKLDRTAGTSIEIPIQVNGETS